MPRILIVEDYPPLAKVMAIAARRLGHEVDRAGTVQRALEAVGEFDIAVVDLDLPDGSGLALAKELKLAGRLKRVVFYTATRDGAVRLEALRLGPVVDKTSSVEVLMDILSEELQLRPEAARLASGEVVETQPRMRSGLRRRVR